MTPPAHRAPRPERDAAPPLPAIDTLQAEHRAMLEHMTRFDDLVAHLLEDGADDRARELAAAVRDHFDLHARAHHAEEERVVFPPLLASADAELVHDVRRLQQDHGWLEQDWIEIGPQLDAVARGQAGCDLALLREALPVFRSLYEEHIALEEVRVYPRARQHHEAQTAADRARGETCG
ncbi:MAG: hemerythrin domain-containing protein [Burkholderiales bacterium]|nr:hemerythrin domain-containing protein [Burkholderiales bacterium]